MSEKNKLKPEQAQALKELEKLIDDSIPQVKKIEYDTFGVKTDGKNVIGLGLYDQGLSTLPESIGNFSSLKELWLYSNKLSTLPESIGNLTSLQILKLESNQLTTLPESIGNLSSLKELYLNDNQLTTITESIGNLTSLQGLGLDNNQLKELPESIGNLTSLKELYLGGNQLSTLPESITKLTSLEKLELQWNKLTTLPESITKLTSLKTLFLGDNQLEALSESIGDLKSLQELSLERNEFTTFPESITKLTSLQTLFLGDNQLEALPESITKLTSLQTLYLESNQLEALPEFITELISLQTLILSWNQLEALPESITKLTSLQTLILSWNQLEALPESITKLTLLQTLYLENNQLEALPESIGNLESLQDLNLEGNNLSSLPESFSQLRALQSINLRNNKWKKELDFLVNSGVDIKIILEYCRNKKFELNEIRYLEDYDPTKSKEEISEIFQKKLSEVNHSEFINIGTNLEKKEISIMQNFVFYNQIPIEISLNEKNKTLKEIKINVIQINSLKGVKSKKEDKIGYFLFFAKQFWDETDLSNNVLIYNQNNSWINSKIDELLSLSLLNNPKLIVFPENSVPYSKIASLKEFSKKHNVTIVCGLEHKGVNSEYINKALIIDNGKQEEQIKQTPVEIKQKDGNHLRENIKCEISPRIKIFLTSIGRIAIFICKDFLRLCDKIPEWASKNKVDFIIIPSLTSKVLPFHFKLLNLLNYSSYNKLKFIFASIGEYGGSEFFSIDQINRVEESFRKNIRDNIGEVIVSRKYIIHRKNIVYKDGWNRFYNDFFKTWRDIEVNLKNFALIKDLAPSIPRPITTQNVIDILEKKDLLTKEFGLKVRNMLKIKNEIIHNLKDFEIDEIQEKNEELMKIHEELIEFMNQ